MRAENGEFTSRTKFHTILKKSQQITNKTQSNKKVNNKSGFPTTNAKTKKTKFKASRNLQTFRNAQPKILGERIYTWERNSVNRTANYAADLTVMHIKT